MKFIIQFFLLKYLEMTLFVINANQMFLILLLVSCISLIKTEAIAKESKSHIVSKITIITIQNMYLFHISTKTGLPSEYIIPHF